MAAVAPENPVSLTAWWTLVARYEDAVSDRPVAGDTFAHLFVNDEARAVADQFRSLTVTNVSLPVRHRLIDDRLSAELARNPALRVVVLGCGFDSRPYRLRGVGTDRRIEAALAADRCSGPEPPAACHARR